MNAGAQPIKDKQVALLVEQDYEDSEVFGPLETIRAAGADVIIVGPTAPTEYRGKHGGVITSTVAAGRAQANDFDAVIVPPRGGVGAQSDADAARHGRSRPRRGAGRQAGGRDLPRTPDAHLRQRPPRQDGYLLALDRRRHQERRRLVHGQTRRRGRQPHHLA